MKVIVSIITLALLSACDKPAEIKPPPRPALVMKVGNPVEAKGMALVGEVVPRFESNQGFRVAGKIITRKVEVGQTVKKGQQIAQLDPADMRLAASASNADVRAAEADYELAVDELNRQRQLVDKKFISQSVLDRHEAQVKTAKARLKQAKSQAYVSYNQTRYSHLYADRDGVISMVRAEPGQVVEAGEVVAKITGTEEVEVAVTVPESRMQKLKVGDEVSVRLWVNSQKRYAAKVREIAPRADSATRTFSVRVAVDQPDEELRFGMTTAVVFAADLYEKLLIPASAVTQKQGKTIVWVVDSNKTVQMREVVTGMINEEGIVIESGLSVGDTIAVVGVHTLTQGQKVNPKFIKSMSSVGV